MTVVHAGAFHRLVVRHLAGENSPAEEQLLVECLQNPAHRAVYDELAAAWHQANARPKTEFDVEGAVARLRREMAQENHLDAGRKEVAKKPPGAPLAFWRRGAWGTAAAAVIVVVISLVWSQRLPAKTEWAEQRTGAGERRDVVLPDGTKVQLNAQSTLGFPAAFKRGPRRVTLSGEGFFEISRDERQPFVVETSAVVVTAHATRFNLAAYDGEVGGMVAVVSGEAQLVQPNQPSPIRLGAAQSYAWADATGVGRVEPIDRESALAWREARLVFKNTPLPGVAKKLSRKFGVPVEVAATFPSEVKITAHFTAETLEEICAALELTDELVCRTERSIGGGVMRVDFLPPAR